MPIKNGPRYEQLVEALDALSELNIPDHLQEVALVHLLGGAKTAIQSPVMARGRQLNTNDDGADAGDLRSFVAKKNPKGAVAEIPLLLYWAKENEGLEKANERDVVELYRRAGLRPAKDIAQSFRDLCSKKYLRLEVPAGERGYVRLARAGEDFVIHDLISK